MTMARAGLALTILLAAGIGFVVSQRPALAAVTIGLGLLATALARRPVVLAIASVPGVLLLTRTAGDALSVAQALGALAAFLAIPAVTRERLPSRYWYILAVVGAYLAAIGVIVLIHPTPAAAENWVLRANIMAGGLLVGAWLTRAQVLRPALVLYLIAIAGLGLATTITGILADFEPVGAFGFYHKNYVGAVSAAALIILIAGRSVHRLPRRWVVLLAAPILTGLLASQSRGGMLSLAIGLIVWALAERVPGASRRVAAALLVGGTVTVVAIQSILTQAQVRDLTVTSAEIRQLVTDQTLSLWESSPWVGVGLRFHVDPAYRTRILDNGASNVVVEALGEGGILSLSALVLLAASVALALLRARSSLAILALALFTARLAHGTVDVYWTFVTTYVPWVLVGAALSDEEPPPPPRGARGRVQEDERDSRRSVTGTMGSTASAASSSVTSSREP
jgi:hypothetical protein